MARATDRATTTRTFACSQRSISTALHQEQLELSDCFTTGRSLIAAVLLKSAQAPELVSHQKGASSYFAGDHEAALSTRVITPPYPRRALDHSDTQKKSPKPTVLTQEI